ncbi:hypothetical protein ACLI09_02595 [Flavobacterium sp. RHBU_24]|uniref:hypothetical protein n=1 Tax=Flavobacterium sp. RHBU_24 TaxID=3391185 RepID=UPI0039850CD9
MSLDKIIELNSANFDRWDEQLDEHYELQYNPGNFDSDESESIFFQTNGLLMAIASNFFSFGKFKDQWDTSKCHINFMGQNLLLKSEKMNITFDWGLDRNEFYMDAYIMYPENIRYMTDDFWGLLLELKTLGTFEYTGSGYLSTEERLYFENKTSTVFQMVRNFMLYQVEKMQGTNYQQPPSMDIGRFVLRWHAHTEWRELLEKTCKAFKLLYIINYQLWKISDLARKKSEKRKE